jgi:hypothetical protein
VDLVPFLEQRLSGRLLYRLAADKSGEPFQPEPLPIGFRYRLLAEDASGRSDFRFFKTHMHVGSLLSRLVNPSAAGIGPVLRSREGRRVLPGLYLYVAREPKDALVSMYNHMQLFHDYGYTPPADIVAKRAVPSAFVEDFMLGRVEGGKYTDHLTRWLERKLPDTDDCDQAEQFAAYRAAETKAQKATAASSGSDFSDEPIFVQLEAITYEELHFAPLAALKRVIAFLTRSNAQLRAFFARDPTAFSDARLQALLESCTFKHMSADPSANFSWAKVAMRPGFTFMRKGVVGDWQEAGLQPADVHRVHRQWSELSSHPNENVRRFAHKVTIFGTAHARTATAPA